MGLWILTRYDDVATVLRDGRFGRKGFDVLIRGRFGENSFDQSMLFRDPPDHTRLRALVSKAFTRGSSRRCARRSRRRWTTCSTSSGCARDDVITDSPTRSRSRSSPRCWACPRRTGTLSRVVADIARSLDAISLPTDPEVVERATPHAGRCRATSHAGRRARRRPQRDLLSELIAVEEQGDKLSEEELMATILLLFVAGHETTVNLIGNGTLALLRNPDQLQALRRSRP